MEQLWSDGFGATAYLMFTFSTYFTAFVLAICNTSAFDIYVLKNYLLTYLHGYRI